MMRKELEQFGLVNENPKEQGNRGYKGVQDVNSSDMTGNPYPNMGVGQGQNGGRIAGEDMDDMPGINTPGGVWIHQSL